jgi:hypothetical protein
MARPRPRRSDMGWGSSARRLQVDRGAVDGAPAAGDAERHTEEPGAC